MPEDYKTQVLQCYLEKKKNNSLSNNLKSPTAAKIKKECMIVYGRKHSLKDNDVLRSFFDLDEDRDFAIFLKKTNPEKFRPVDNFIKDVTQDPRERTVELLAWLIDFEIDDDSVDNPAKKIKEENLEEVEDDFKIPFLPIPISDCHAKDGYEVEDLRGAPEANNIETHVDENIKTEFTQREEFSNEGLNEKEVKNYKEEDSQEDFEKEYTEENHNKGKNVIKKGEKNGDKVSLLKKWGLGLVATFFLTSFVFFPRYMTWKGDRYEWLFFASKDASVIAIDWDLIRNFRKVTRKDTLTKHSVGRLWYLKESNNHDVFTMGGKHPIYSHRNLHLLSSRILDSIQSRIKLEKLANERQSLVSK